MSSATRLAVAGAVATMLSMLALIPVTESASWVIPAAVLVVAITGSGLLARRYGVPRMLVHFIQIVVALLWIGLFVASDVAFFGVVPTWAWFDRIIAVVGEGIDTANRYAAPVPLARGIFTLIIGGTALVAIFVDVCAVTLRRVTLAGLPLLSIYAVAASVVTGGVSWALFVPVAAGFLVLLVAERRHAVAHWGRAVTLAEGHARGEPQAASLARNGRRLGTAAIATAVVLPALLPGLPESVFGSGGSGGGGVIRTNNPIVDLKRDLVRPDNVEVFRYRTDDPTPEYTRVVTLDQFNGELWQPSARQVPRGQRVANGVPAPPGLDPEVPRETSSYDFSVRDNFQSRWLPMPYPPHSVEIQGDWRYDAATLDVVAMTGTTGGVNYVVQAYELEVDGRALRNAGRTPEGVEALTALPANLPDAVRDLAAEVTAGATTAFDRAAALQRWFRSSGGFSYDLTVRPGNSSTALMDFLEDKRGYCEQFAATMAIMARALKIPARVATGYLPGDNVTGNEWVVRAHDAHAWPELFFEGTGWVRFEPTPSTRTGTAPSWTLPPVDAGDDEAAPAAVPSTAADDAAQGAAGQERINEVNEPLGNSQLQPGFPWQRVLGGIAVLLVLAMPAATAWARRRLRWRDAKGDPGREVEAAWADLRDTVRDAGFAWDAAETPRWTGRRLAGEADLTETGQDLLQHLVRTTENTRYARTPDPVDSLREDSSILRKAILTGRPLRHRVKALVWPSGAEDVMTATANRVADGLDWVDTTGDRLRTATRDRLPGRRTPK